MIEDVHYLSHLFNNAGHQVLGLARVLTVVICKGVTGGGFRSSTRPRNSHIGDKRNLFRALRTNANLTVLLDDKENTTVVLSAINYNQMIGAVLEDPT